jgi:nitroreductase
MSLDKEIEKQLCKVYKLGMLDYSHSNRQPWDVTEATLVAAQDGIKQAFIDAGWKYIPMERVVYNPDAENYADRFPKMEQDLAVIYDQRHSYYFSGDLNRFKEAKQLMTGQEWLDKTLRAFHIHKNENDYFRDDKAFRSSTVTMAEVEAILKKASSLK